MSNFGLVDGLRRRIKTTYITLSSNLVEIAILSLILFILESTLAVVSAILSNEPISIPSYGRIAIMLGIAVLAAYGYVAEARRLQERGRAQESDTNPPPRSRSRPLLFGVLFFVVGASILYVSTAFFQPIREVGALVAPAGILVCLIIVLWWVYRLYLR
jgi:hypothetical protein